MGSEISDHFDKFEQLRCSQMTDVDESLYFHAASYIIASEQDQFSGDHDWMFEVEEQSEKETLLNPTPNLRPFCQYDWMFQVQMLEQPYEATP